jgi:hypothetical protein
MLGWQVKFDPMIASGSGDSGDLCYHDRIFADLGMDQRFASEVLNDIYNPR